MKLTIIWLLHTILAVHLTTAISITPDPHRPIARARGRPGSLNKNAGFRGGRNTAADPPPQGPPPPPPPFPAPATPSGGGMQPALQRRSPRGPGGGPGGNAAERAMFERPASSASSSPESVPQLTEETDFVYAPVDELVYDYEDVYEPTLEYVDEYAPQYEPTLEYVDEYAPQYEPTLGFVDEYAPQYEPTLEYVDEDVLAFSPTTEYHVEYSEQYASTFSSPESDDTKAKDKPVNINNNSNHIGINLDMSHHLGEEHHQDNHNDHPAPPTAIAPYTPLLPDATSPNPPGKTHYPTKIHLLQEDRPHHVSTDPAGGIRVQTVNGVHRIVSILSWPTSSKLRRCQLVFNLPKTGGGRVHAHALSGSVEGATWGKKPSRGKHLGTWNAGYGGTEGKWEVGTGEVVWGTAVELSWADGTDGGVWWPTNGVGVVMLEDGATNLPETTNVMAVSKPKKAPVRVRGPVKKVYGHV